MVFIRVNVARVQDLAIAVNSLGREKVLLFEDIDPQYKAIKRVVEICEGYAPLLVVLNALVSYRLSMRGEDYWTRFSDYVIQYCTDMGLTLSADEIVRKFIERFNRVMLRQKLSRVFKVVRCKGILEAIELLPLTDVWKRLSQCLNTNPSSKTVVFAIKMLYYTRKALGEKVNVPIEIPIPVDSRVALVTYLSGALEVRGVGINRKLLLKYSNAIRNVWSEVARLSGIPPLNLDAMVWYFGRYADSNSRSEVLKKVLSELSGLLSEGDVKMLIDNIFYLLPE